MLKSITKKNETTPLLFEMPEPYTGERPTDYADRVGQWYAASVSSAHKKNLGQYFTPVEVADFMAELIAPRNITTRILDPGAGVGILACAACESLISQKKKALQLILDVYETDQNLAIILQKTLSYLAVYAMSHNVTISFKIHAEDFILKYAHILEKTPTFFDSGKNCTEFDVCISNPPYFKLPKSDSRAQAAALVVYGQPNIYALFMAISASLLSRNGELIFITPRSFASGPYFQAFREYFFETVKPEFIHIFDSRRDAFERDGVLQENIIIKAIRNNKNSNLERTVMISASSGIKDLKQAKRKNLTFDAVLNLDTKEKILKIPHNDNVEAILNKMSHWHGSLHKYGLEISTGPVVPFRAVDFISHKKDRTRLFAPLLWLQNVQPMNVVWPANARHKPQYIQISPESAYLLVPNKNYVLLRRFSAKEEARRLIAAQLVCGTLPDEWIGLENHLNYIHRPSGTLSQEETLGLAVLYNSSFFDAYFRMLNGSTQVSATEVRSIPLPSLEIITEIGIKAMDCQNISENIDSLAYLALQNTHTKLRKQHV